MFFNPIKFFTPSYFLELQPFTTGTTIKIMVAIGIIMLVPAIAAKYYSVKGKLPGYQKKTLGEVASWFFTFAIVDLLWTWFKYERVAYLSARFWSIIILAVAAWWAFLIFRRWRKVAPQAAKQAEQHQQYLKYLPKKK